MNNNNIKSERVGDWRDIGEKRAIHFHGRERTQEREKREKRERMRGENMREDD